MTGPDDFICITQSKKISRGAGTHTGHTRDTRAHTRTGNSNTDFRNETHAEKDRTPFGHFTTLRRVATLIKRLISELPEMAPSRNEKIEKAPVVPIRERTGI